MNRSYFLNFKEAYQWCLGKYGQVNIYSLTLGPHDSNVEELVEKAKKRKRPGTAIVVYKDTKNWINSRFEILDL